jgi:GNAT superfamily N-acetyltransferase
MVTGRSPLSVMRLRFARGTARCLCLFEDGELCAYGWVQSWGPFRRKFGFLASDAVMLGPYFTFEAYRGKGLYRRLLLTSVRLCCERPERPILVYTWPENTASQRGIEKAGFQYIGTYQVTSALLGLIHRHRLIEANVPRSSTS